MSSDYWGDWWKCLNVTLPMLASVWLFFLFSWLNRNGRGCIWYSIGSCSKVLTATALIIWFWPNSNDALGELLTCKLNRGMGEFSLLSRTETSGHSCMDKTCTLYGLLGKDFAVVLVSATSPCAVFSARSSKGPSYRSLNARNWCARMHRLSFSTYLVVNIACMCAEAESDLCRREVVKNWSQVWTEHWVTAYDLCRVLLTYSTDGPVTLF